ASRAPARGAWRLTGPPSSEEYACETRVGVGTRRRRVQESRPTGPVSVLLRLGDQVRGTEPREVLTYRVVVAAQHFGELGDRHRMIGRENQIEDPSAQWHRDRR